MNWLIIPIEDLKLFDPNWKDRRKNVDGTEALLHEEIYNKLVPPSAILGLSEEPVSIDYPFELLSLDSIVSLMETEDWEKYLEQIIYQNDN